MNGQELVDLAIAKMTAMTDPEIIVNISTPFVLAGVNEGYRTVERAALWKFSEAEATLTTVVGQQDYDEATDIATDLVNIQHIYDPESYLELEFLDERQQVFDYGQNTGIPEAYSRWSNRIRLFPTPSVVRDLTVRYYAQWDDLTLATEPVFPAMYHDMLADFAAQHLALRMPVSQDLAREVQSYRLLPAYRAKPFQDAFATKLNQMMNDPRATVSTDRIISHEWRDYVHYSQDW